MSDSFDLAELKARNPIEEVAGRYTTLRRAGRALVGPCPICGGSRRNARFEVKDDGWVCAVCQDGGDVIALVQKVENCDFRTAVERLGGAKAESDESRSRREAQAAERRARQERDSERFREDERKRVHRFWKAAGPAQRTPVEAYLHARGVALPEGALLRAAPDAVLYSPGEPPTPLHTGWAMLAAITGPAGRFAGLHATWIDPDAPGRKIEVADPETGELSPAKKVRGSKKGGRIELVRCADPARLFIGEGIETVLSVWMALRQLGSPLLEGAAFWTSVDLGNLGGPAAGSIDHPTERTLQGRPRRLPGPVPGDDGPSIPIPATVTDLVLLGDGDSDPVLTRTTLQRAAARWATPMRRVRLAFAPEGRDFNDLVRAA